MIYLDEKIPNVTLPEGQSGDWKVTKKTVTPEEESKGRMHAAISRSSGGRFTPAGEYTFLYRKGTLVMSDVPDEKEDHLPFVRNARGNVLVAGLGLGMVVNALLKKEQVTSVTVVEKSEDVINLVASHLKEKYGDRFNVICDDILTWKPEGKYDFGWYDIWDNICTDNLSDMKRIHRRLGRRVKTQGSWCRELLNDRV